MITPASSASTASSGATAPRTTSLGRDEFLKLLVTQLKNQDPLAPLQPHEFAAQLAQFSSVEQLTQLNDGMNAQSEAVRMSTLLGEASFGSSLIGREIVADGNQIVVGAGGAGHVRIEVGGAGGAATLKIKDSAGQVVATKELGSLGAGRQNVALPSGLAPGTYTYEVQVTAPDGKAVPVATYTTGIVDGVHFTDGKIILRMGPLEVSLDTVAEIAPATQSTTAAGALRALVPAASKLNREELHP